MFLIFGNGAFKPNISTLPWLTGDAVRRLQSIRSVVYLAFPSKTAREMLFPGKRHWLGRAFGLTWNAVMESGGIVVGETVDVTIEAELVRG